MPVEFSSCSDEELENDLRAGRAQWPSERASCSTVLEGIAGRQSVEIDGVSVAVRRGACYCVASQRYIDLMRLVPELLRRTRDYGGGNGKRFHDATQGALGQTVNDTWTLEVPPMREGGRLQGTAAVATTFQLSKLQWPHELPGVDVAGFYVLRRSTPPALSGQRLEATRRGRQPSCELVHRQRRCAPATSNEALRGEMAALRAQLAINALRQDVLGDGADAALQPLLLRCTNNAPVTFAGDELARARQRFAIPVARGGVYFPERCCSFLSNGCGMLHAGSLCFDPSADVVRANVDANGIARSWLLKTTDSNFSAIQLCHEANTPDSRARAFESLGEGRGIEGVFCNRRADSDTAGGGSGSIIPVWTLWCKRRRSAARGQHSREARFGTTLVHHATLDAISRFTGDKQAVDEVHCERAMPHLFSDSAITTLLLPCPRSPVAVGVHGGCSLFVADARVPQMQVETRETSAFAHREIHALSAAESKIVSIETENEAGDVALGLTVIAQRGDGTVELRDRRMFGAAPLILWQEGLGNRRVSRLPSLQLVNGFVAASTCSPCLREVVMVNTRTQEVIARARLPPALGTSRGVPSGTLSTTQQQRQPFALARNGKNLALISICKEQSSDEHAMCLCEPRLTLPV